MVSRSQFYDVPDLNVHELLLDASNPRIRHGVDQHDCIERIVKDRAVDALETALSFYVDDRKPLPTPSKPKRGQKTVCPSALESAKLGVYQEMMVQGLRKSELARRLGWHMPQVDRLFDLKHASKLDQIEAAAHVLGKNILVSVV